MHFSPILLAAAAAATLLPSVTADCASECVNAVNACCKNHNTAACDALGPNGCGADTKEDACNNQRADCNGYCGSSPALADCLASLRF